MNFTNIKTNAISFGGFDEVDPENPGTGDFIVDNIQVMNSVFESPDSLMQTKKYSYTGEAKFIVQNSVFENLRFDKFGNIFSLTHNAK